VPPADDSLLRSLFPIALGEYLSPGPPDPEHRVATIAFVRFSGTDAILAEQGPGPLAEALNGASVRTETIDGPVEVKVPKGAKEGTKLRLRGKGVSRGKNAGCGDQLVEIHIVLPEGADEALAQFMADWEKTHPQDPRGKGAT